MVYYGILFSLSLRISDDDMDYYPPRTDLLLPQPEMRPPSPEPMRIDEPEPFVAPTGDFEIK